MNMKEIKEEIRKLGLMKSDLEMMNNNEIKKFMEKERTSFINLGLEYFKKAIAINNCIIKIKKLIDNK